MQKHRVRVPAPKDSLTRDRPEEVGLSWTEVDRAVAPALPGH
ncbi:hypothetical protein STXM2123_4477 [Streptomyces sp. F-3]|nr:hypothetical protein STXM2123_4477 [Streptomyces sp. F-3]